MFSLFRLIIYAFMGLSFACLGLLAIIFRSTDFLTLENGIGWNNIAGLIGAIGLFMAMITSDQNEMERENDELANLISLRAFRFAFCLGIFVAVSSQILALFYDISLQSLYISLIMSLLAGYYISYVWLSLNRS